MSKVVSASILFSFLIFRIYAILLSPTGLSGDAVGYVSRAEYIAENFRLPPVKVQPIGFSILLTPIYKVFGDRLPQFILYLHLSLDLLIIATLLVFCKKLFLHPAYQRLRFIVSALLIFQPFTATLVNAVYTEQIITFLMFYGTCLLGCYITYSTWNIYIMIFASLLFAIISLMRIELTIISMLLIGWSITVKYFNRTNFRSVILETTAAVSVFILTFGSIVVLQYNSTGELAIVKKQFHNDGYMSWLRTWFAFEKIEHNRLAFSIATSNWPGWDISVYPPRAFDSQDELYRVKNLLNKMKNEGYSAEIDAKFKKLAFERVTRNPIRHYVLNPVLRILHYWINIDGSQTYLKTYVFPKYIRWPFIGLVLLGKGVILFFALFGSYCLWIKPDRLADWEYIVQLGRLSFLAVVLRTIMLGMLGTFVWAGLMETRYILVVYPSMIVLCLVGIRYFFHIAHKKFSINRFNYE